MSFSPVYDTCTAAYESSQTMNEVFEVNVQFSVSQSCCKNMMTCFMKMCNTFPSELHNAYISTAALIQLPKKKDLTL